MMNIAYKEWDSVFFGMHIGQLNLGEEEELNPVRFKEVVRDEGYDLVYVFRALHPLTLDLVRDAGLDLVDVQVTSVKKFVKEDYLHQPYAFRTALSPDELRQCHWLSETIAPVSRFRYERAIDPAVVRKLYRTWIDNTVNQSFADGLVLTADDSGLTGFCIVKTDDASRTGYLPLAGVNPLIKQRGIGRRLFEQAFGYWANEKDIDEIRGTSSLQNIDSSNFQIKMGLNRIEKINYVYHHRNHRQR